MRVRVATLLIGIAAALLAPLACTYDFTVAKRSPSADGAVPDETDDGGATDAGAGTPSDGGPQMDAHFNCAELTFGLAQLRENAIACSITDPYACLTVVKDECNCNVGVGSNGAPTAAYRQGIAMYRDAGCTPTCPACPQASDFACDTTTGGNQGQCAPF